MTLPDDFSRWFGVVNGDAAPSTLLSDFIARGRAMNRPRVLELGTMQSIPGRSTMHKEWFPDAGEYLGTDIGPGPDVDIVADAHRLSRYVGEAAFDIIVSCSTFEHFKYPHLAAHEILKALRVGGVVMIQTHHTFPLHAYPYDYFRFSTEALTGLFGTRMGFETIMSDYEFPASIHALREPASALCAAYLNVRLYGRKTGPTPAEYVYEFDADIPFRK